MMKAKYFDDDVSIYIHCNFDLRDRYDSLNDLLDIEGVTNLRLHKYSVGVGFGFLFQDQSDRIKYEVLEKFKSLTGIERIEEISKEELLERALGSLSTDVDPSDISEEQSIEIMSAMSDGFSEA